MEIDRLDRRLLAALHQDASLSQRELADRIGLSQNALWRRLKRLEAEGFVLASRTRINLSALGLDLTVFVMVRTRRHRALVPPPRARRPRLTETCRPSQSSPRVS